MVRNAANMLCHENDSDLNLIEDFSIYHIPHENSVLYHGTDTFFSVCNRDFVSSSDLPNDIRPISFKFPLRYPEIDSENNSFEVLCDGIVISVIDHVCHFENLSKFPFSPLLINFSVPSLDASGSLAVSMPHKMYNVAGKEALIPSGSLHYYGKIDSELAITKSVENSIRLLLSSQSVGLPPAGSALVLSCDEAQLGNLISCVLKLTTILGFGPFVPMLGIGNCIYDQVIAENPSLYLSSYHAFINTDLMHNLHQIANSLYGHENKLSISMFDEDIDISLIISLSLTIDSALKNVSGLGTNCSSESRLRIFGDTIYTANRWANNYMLDFSGVLHSLLQSRFLQKIDLSSLNRFSQQIKLILSNTTNINHLPCKAGIHVFDLPPTGMRQEQDAIGFVDIPAHAHYGIQTVRSLKNFALGTLSVGSNRKFVHAMGLVKQACADANVRIGKLDPVIGNAIAKAASEVIEGIWDHAFPVDQIQGGGGVGMNMNINEVIAIRASEILDGKLGSGLVHPNDHVNMSHSTNDLVHTSMHIAFLDWLLEIDAQLESLEDALNHIVTEHSSTVKLGRTCLMDALPMTVGQQFSAHLSFVSRRRKIFSTLATQCSYLAMGAGGVGTGIGVAPGFLTAFFEILSYKKRFHFRPADNTFDALRHVDFYQDISSSLKSYSSGLSSLARDLRMMGSGPLCGFSEIKIPAVQPGSSIMPGKINPVIPELINQVAYIVCGNDLAVTMSAEGGDIDLNVWESVFLECITDSFRLLSNGTAIFVDKCLRGIDINRNKCLSNAESSLALATVISEIYGYKKGVEIALLASSKSITISKAAVISGLMSEEDASILLDPMLLTQHDKYNMIMEAYRRKQSL